MKPRWEFQSPNKHLRYLKTGLIVMGIALVLATIGLGVVGAIIAAIVAPFPFNLVFCIALLLACTYVIGWLGER